MAIVKLGKAFSSSGDLFKSEFGPAEPEEERAYNREVLLQHISATLYGMRTIRGLSRETLAERAEMTVEDVTRLESEGEDASFSEVERVLSALNYSLSLTIRDAAAFTGAL